jgi:hypothetical protein
MDIHLEGEQYRCLGDNIPQSSALWEKFTNATQSEHVGADGIYHAYVIKCSLAEAQALLEIATALCPGAVDGIKVDIQRVRETM